MVSKTRFGRSILLGLLSAGALAGASRAAEVIRPMELGAATYAPPGFTAFCARAAEACEVTQARAEAEDALVSQVNARATRALFLQALATLENPGAPIRAAYTSPMRPEPVSLDYEALTPKAAPDAPMTTLAPDEPVATMAQILTSGPRRALGRDEPISTASVDWKRVKAVNTQVNRAIYRSTDLQTYGQEEVWALPLQSGVTYGDCEDYVLEKRRALLEAGFDRKNLNIAVVTTWAGERHAVLLVRAAEGEFVLDNLTSRILPWNKAGYDWNERQVEGRTYDWVEVGQPPSRHSAPVRRDLLIAALQ